MMGLLSWRGKASEETVSAAGAETVTATGVDGGVNPQVDLRNFKKHHKWDPFLDLEKLDAVDAVLQSGDIEKEAVVEEQLLLEDSPYAEVRTSVSHVQSVTRTWNSILISCCPRSNPPMTPKCR